MGSIDLKDKRISRRRTAEHNRKIGLANTGERHGLWKGDKVGYGSLHNWLKRHLQKPNLCELCKKVIPHDVANKTGKYLRDVTDWQWLCCRCHMKSDGRLERLKPTQFKAGIKRGKYSIERRRRISEGIKEWHRKNKHG